MQILKYFIFLYLGFTGAANAVPVTLASFNCDNQMSVFASGLTSVSNFFYRGTGSCRGNPGVYQLNLSAPVTVAQKNFDLSFYSRRNTQYIITAVFSNGTTVLLNRTQINSVIGQDGGTWFFMTYRFSGPANDNRSLSSIRFTYTSTEWLDDVLVTVDDNIVIANYMKFQTGFNNVEANYNLDDVLNLNPEPVLFRLAGRIPSGQVVDIEVIDENQFTYLECSQVSINSIRFQLTDSLGASYSVSCLSSQLSGNKRSLFRITNTGSSPLLEVEIDVQFNGLPRINPDATSSSFLFNLDIQMTLL